MGHKPKRECRAGAALAGVCCVLMGVAPLSAQAPTSSGHDYRSLAREIFKELVEIKSTESGVGSTPAAEAVARRLRAAGFPASDLQLIGPVPQKMNVVARLRGSGKAKPILIIGHLDVVEARKEDWSPGLDPFQFTERDGYFYGRGTQDMKGAAAIVVTNFIRWKQEGWVPPRDLILALTADEELYNELNGVKWLTKNHRPLIDAEYSLNSDGGDYTTRAGKPFSITVETSEKKETILQLETHNRGGHASLPRQDNAIYELIAAVDRLRTFRFPVALNEVTRAQLTALAALASGQTATDVRAVLQDPPSAEAVDRLSRDPFDNALLRTTCVATMLDAGLFPSALPNRARATINCRLLPGHAASDALQTLRKTIADDSVRITWLFNEPFEGQRSPSRSDVFASVTQVAQRMWPGVAVLPGMGTGMTDARFLRAAGIPSYGVSGLFIEEGDVRAHGKDERVRANDFYAGVDFYDRFMKALVTPQKPSRAN